jgi:predicted nucleic acid-binding Zn ribbon protein
LKRYVYRKEPDLAQGSDGFWEQLAKNENSDESRARVLRVVKLATDRNSAELNKVLADYICIPWISFAQDERPKVRFGAVDPSYEILHYQPETPRLCRFPAEEVMAVLSVLQLAQAGYLDELRVCPICGEAFVAIKAAQKTCSAKCSKRRHATTPEERKRRSAAARARYDLTFGVPKKRKAQDAR